MLTFISRIFNGNVPGRFPVLVVSLGIGALLITGGVAMRAQQDQGIEIAMAGTSTALAPTLTPSQTATATDTSTPTDTPTVTLTPSNTPTGTLPPTDTPAPTDTPSPTPVPASTVQIVVPTASTEGAPLTVPTPMPQVDRPSDVVNIMLLGSDYRPELHESNLTDTIIIVSINKKEGTVNMLSLPRDLYVYAPRWGVAKINTVYGHGQGVGSPGGGAGLLAETLLYNFGITVQHYALVDLTGFRSIVDIIGGIEVPVDCNYTGFRLKAPVLTPDDFGSYEDYVDYTDPESNPNNWETYTLPVGVHHLDGYMGLWYARFRKDGTDFERSVRQQQVLRAILHTARDQGMLNVVRIPQLWSEYNDLVETNMGLGNMLQLLPVATDLDAGEIGSYNITDLIVSYTPQEGTFAGIAGYMLHPELGDAIQNRMAIAMGPPAQTLLTRYSPVEIRNGTTHDGFDQIVAEQLGVFYNNMVIVPTGFETGPHNANQTVIIDYTGQQKSNQLVQIQRKLKVADKNVIVQPDPNRTVDYVIVLGEDYYNTVNSCARIDPDTRKPNASGTEEPTNQP